MSSCHPRPSTCRPSPATSRCCQPSDLSKPRIANCLPRNQSSVSPFVSVDRITVRYQITHRHLHCTRCMYACAHRYYTACISLRAHAQQVTPLGANDVSFARDLEINGWNIVAFTDERSLSSPTLSRLPVACLCVCACACMRVCTLFCTRIPIFMSTRAKNKGKGT